jgi:hypothetical protein
LGGLGRALQKRGVRIFQNTEAEAFETGDGSFPKGQRLRPGRRYQEAAS